MLKSNESKIWFVAIVAIVGCFAIGDAALAQEKADLSIPAAVGQGKSAVAQQASKRSVGCNCGPLQAPVALKAASAAKTYKPAKRIKLNKLNHRQLSRSTVKFAEVEIVLSDQFNIEYVFALPRAPGSDLEVLDGPRRVRVQLPADCVEALVDEGAEITVLRKFILVKGSIGKARTPERDMATLQRKLDSYDSDCYGSNGSNIFIPDGTNPTWVYSEICISCAPPGATVSSIDVHYEIIHTCNSDLDVDLNDENLDCEYHLWQMSNPTTCPDNINETETGITVCNGELVNQCWRLWAIDRWTLDTGYIDYWWIRVYYGSPPSPPPNNECVNAIPVVEGVPYYGSTVGATGAYESSCGYNDTADVWHSYTPTSTGTATISLRGSTFDTTLTVFDECGGAELSCNDDISYPSNIQSEIMMTVVGAQTYLIRIAGFDGDAGNYTLSVTRMCVLPDEPNSPNPANDANNVAVNTILSWNNSEAKAFQAKSNKDVMSPSKGVVTPKVIYGEDDRREECEVDDPNILSVGDSVVALVNVDDLIPNYNGTFSLPAQTYADWYQFDRPRDNPNQRPLCSDEPFYDQPVPAFCSGFLVAPDIIATAGHCEAVYSCGDVAFVFGFVMDGLDCNVPVLTIDESEIYYCNEVIASTLLGSDWALIRLDREVVGHSPLRVRVAGAIDNGEPLLVIGHPVGLPRKYAGGAEVKSNNVLSPFFEANLDTYKGSSGGPVFNANTLQVEGILVRGNPDWEPNGPCDSSDRCSDDGCPGWEAVTRTTEFTPLFAWAIYDVYFGTTNPPIELIYSDLEEPMCKPYDPCSPDGTLRPGTTYYWQVVAKNSCGETPGPNDPNDCWTFTTEDVIDVNVTLNNDWMYQNLPGSNDCNLTACAEIINDPCNNNSYSYTWEFILPTDVTLKPNIIGPNDISCCTFAARGCDEPNGISDSGQVFTVKVTVGDDHGNTGTAEAQFGIAFLGDVNNDCVVNVIDRAIITSFWRTGSVGSCFLRDCDLNCDGSVNIIDRSIVTAIWKGTLCQNSVSNPCPLRSPCP